MMVDRVHRDLTDADIAKIAGTYHAWRGDKPAPDHDPGMRARTSTCPAFAKSRSSMTSASTAKC